MERDDQTVFIVAYLANKNNNWKDVIMGFWNMLAEKGKIATLIGLILSRLLNCR